jgi:hypothetical protein
LAKAPQAAGPGVGDALDMSEDDRLAKIKDLLDSTLAEFEAVFKSAGTFDQSRVGNGWTPSSIPVQMYLINAMPVDQAAKIAESRKARAFGPVGWFRLRSGRIQLAGDPTLVFFPYWRVKGYHECFYFRGKTYTATVPDDVIAVQVGGRLRPLTSEVKAKRSILKVATARIRRMLRARREPRYFTVDGATELAYQFRDASILLDGQGKENVFMEYLLEKKPQMQRIDERDEPNYRRSTTKFTPLILKSDDAVRILHSKAVRPPPVFSKILTNRFEITELSLIELPIYVFKYKYFGRERELRIHGVTGELVK